MSEMPPTLKELVRGLLRDGPFDEQVTGLTLRVTNPQTAAEKIVVTYEYGRQS